jgi:hypothetical protein
MTGPTKVVVAILIVLLIAVISGFMYAVSTFLFAFSGGQSRMVPIVEYGAIAVVAAMILLAAIVWRLRSPVTAAKYAAIATPAAWVVAMFVEWALSFEFGAG